MQHIPPAPPAIVMPDLRSATRGVVEECTNELDASPKTLGAQRTELTFLVDLGNDYAAIVRCTKTKDGTVHASVSIPPLKYDTDRSK